MKRYTIKQISKILGVNIETLRYYEDVGILQPMKDENNYRKYLIEDIRTFNSCRIYRSFGFSVKDCKELMKFPPFSQVEEKLEEKIEEQKYALARQRLVIKMLERHKKMISDLSKREGYFEIVELPSYYYFHTCKVEEYIKNEDHDDKKAQWVKYFPVSMGMRRIPLEVLNKEKKEFDYENGIAIAKKNAEKIGFPKELLEDTKYYEGGMAYYTIFRKRADAPYDEHIFDPILNKVKESGYLPDGDGFSYVLASESVGGVLYHYHHLRIRVKEM